MRNACASHHSHLYFRPNIARSISTANNIQHHDLQQRSCYTISNEVLDIFDALLKNCTKTTQFREIHAQVYVTGSHRSAFMASRLVSVYSNFGVFKDAQKVFDDFPVELSSNVLLWNSILRANVRHGFYTEALQLFEKMLKRRVFADGFSFPLAIKACSFVGSPALCKRIHSLVVKMGFQNHIHTVNELLGMYAKFGLMNIACQMFDRMSVRTYISWNTMVSGYAFNYDSDGARRTFRRMKKQGLEPNSVTWTSLLSSHARCGRHEECVEFFRSMVSSGVEATAESLAVVLSVCAESGEVRSGETAHGYLIKGGFDDYLFARNTLICMYGKCGDLESSKKCFSEMETKNLVSYNVLISSYAETGLCDKALEVFTWLENMNGCRLLRPNIVSWSAVIGGFASKAGRGEEALELFRRMQSSRVIANCVTICSVLSACAELAAMKLGMEVHGHAIRAMIDGNILVGNALINMYTKSGSFEKGHSVFEKLDGKDIVSWNTMITGFGMHGLGKDALRIFHRMIECGFNPVNVTFVGVLSACSHAGLVAEGRSLFDQMYEVYGVEPQMEHYACVVDLLGRAGMLREASSVVENMPMEPNDCVWSALLNSCRMHQNDISAEETVARVLCARSGAAWSHVLLSNVYAASGRWEESARVRVSAKARGLKKTPGQSWIEVRKKVHVFSAGIATDSCSEKVQRVVHELALQMESQGNVVDEEYI